MPISFRQALDPDFGYCKGLYFEEMEWITEELHLDRAAQAASFHQQWDLTQVRIIALDGSDVGWLQTMTQNDELFCRTDICGPPVSAQRYRHRGDQVPD